LLGRRRVINELKANNRNVRMFGERAAMNMPLQGSSADIIKIAMINVAKRLKEDGYKAKLVLQVHDELNFSVPKAEKAIVEEIVIREMETAFAMQVPLKADCG
jgi:DNA polymerase-1